MCTSSICKWVQCCLSGSDQVDSYYVSDGLLIPCYMCETCLSKKAVGFHADVLREGYKSISLVTAHLLQQKTLSPCLNPPPTTTTTNPPLFLFASQVWYLSGWVCNLQLEKAKEQQEREGREVTEEETEEWKALEEAARSYLTNAKKVIQAIKSAHKPKIAAFWWRR